MKNPIVFLDVDGVLNNRASWLETPGGVMLPHLVRNLHWVVTQADANIVVSSDWRYAGIGVGSSFQLWITDACKHAHIDEDDILTRVIDHTELSDRQREQQILAWVEQHHVENWVAIDDVANYFPSNPSWLVLTDDRVGLDLSRAAAALTKLGFDEW